MLRYVNIYIHGSLHHRCFSVDVVSYNYSVTLQRRPMLSSVPLKTAKNVILLI